MAKHANPSVSKPYKRVILAAIAALAVIVSLFGVAAVASNQATAPTQQTRGVTTSCVLTNSTCTAAHGLGTTPTSVVAIPWGAGQNATVVAKNDTTYTLRFLWRDGTAFKDGTTIKYDVTFNYVGDPVVTPPPTSETPTSPPVSTPPVSTPPTTPTTTPAGYACNPSGAIAHFFPENGGQGEGSDAIGDAQPPAKWGQFNASAEQWGVKNDYLSNMCVYSKDNWYVDIKATNHGDGAVQSYPSMRKIYHDWGSNSFANDPKMSSFNQLKATVAHTSPASCTGCVYEEAFDIWLNGIGDDPSTTEMMIWTHNQGQRPAGDVAVSNVTVDGRKWDVWYDAPGIVSYTPAAGAPSITSGTFDIKAFVKDAGDRKMITTNPSDPKMGQVSYGVEPVDTKGVFKHWAFTKFDIVDS